MPYIKEGARWELSGQRKTENPGELNYQLTLIINEYLRRRHGRSYTGVNEVVGVLECVKQEFYRRVVAPYEDQKIKENGDVY